jgi:hypothetical protein
MDFQICGDNKVRLNLTDLAWKVLDEDRFNFSPDEGLIPLSTFINHLYRNFGSSAEASVAEALNAYTLDVKTKLKFPGLIPPNLDRDEILGVFRNLKRQQLISDISYPKGKRAENIRLSNENADQIEDSPDYSFFLKKSKEKASVGKYLKSIVEEYARKSLVDREACYFKNTFEMIQTAISEKYELKLKTSTNDVVYLMPFSLQRDTAENFHYLVGMAIYLAPNGIILKKNVSFRVSRIASIQPRKTLRVPVSESEWDALEKEVLDKGPQNLGSEASQVKVIFSVSGLKLLKGITIDRPSRFDKLDDKTYIFYTTLSQAEHYFMRFADEATIIEPKSLRKKIANRFKQAAKLYSSESVEKASKTDLHSDKDTKVLK